jgi:hypothetical protein
VKSHEPKTRHARKISVAWPKRGTVIVSDARNQEVHRAEALASAARTLDHVSSLDQTSIERRDIASSLRVYRCGQSGDF